MRRGDYNRWSLEHRGQRKVICFECHGEGQKRFRREKRCYGCGTHTPKLSRAAKNKRAYFKLQSVRQESRDETPKVLDKALGICLMSKYLET